MNGSMHSPALRRAVMRAQPDFYSWDEERQLHYRIHMPDDARFVLERSVFHDLYGIDCANRGALREAWGNVPLDELDAINETLLPWQGIGEDCFVLNEPMPNADRLRFDTLDEYARADHAFQEVARIKDDQDHVARPYQGNIYRCWARLFMNGRLRYANLYSMVGYLSVHISEQAHGLLDILIPHRYVSGPDDGKPEGDAFVWDKRLEAGGLEPQLEELTERLLRYEQRRWFELLQEFDDRADAQAFIQETSDGVEEQLNFVFSDKSAMAQVRLRHFVRDCRRLAHDVSELTRLKHRETDRLRAFAYQQHADIRRHFNPKVAKLKRPTRVLMHKSAFD